MSAYSFLAGLPALLGAVGFFAYLWFGQAKIGGEMFKQIVEKLRTDPNVPSSHQLVLSSFPEFMDGSGIQT